MYLKPECAFFGTAVDYSNFIYLFFCILNTECRYIYSITPYTFMIVPLPVSRGETLFRASNFPLSLIPIYCYFNYFNWLRDQYLYFGSVFGPHRSGCPSQFCCNFCYIGRLNISADPWVQFVASIYEDELALQAQVPTWMLPCFTWICAFGVMS